MTSKADMADTNRIDCVMCGEEAELVRGPVPLCRGHLRNMADAGKEPREPPYPTDKPNAHRADVEQYIYQMDSYDPDAGYHVYTLMLSRQDPTVRDVYVGLSSDVIERVKHHIKEAGSFKTYVERDGEKVMGSADYKLVDILDIVPAGDTIERAKWVETEQYMDACREYDRMVLGGR